MANPSSLPTALDPSSVVIRFNQALNAGDVDGMMQLMSADCVFENTYPPPDGTRYVGQAAVREFWEAFFRDASSARIEMEELIPGEQRCVMIWRYEWVSPGGQSGHIRGVDIYRVENGMITEKLSYVKG